MADQKISELQLVVATGVAATGIYVPLYTPMLAPANRRISAAEFFKTPKRIEVSDPALAGTGEVMTLTTSYGTVSLRAGTNGKFIVGGDIAGVGSVSVVSDSSPLTLGALDDVKLYRDASGVLALRYDRNAQSLKVYNSYTGTHNEFVTLRFLSGAAQLGTFQDGTGIARSLNILTSGVARISAPAASGSAVTITSYDTSQGGVLDLTSPLGTANLRVGAGGQLATLAAFSAAGDISLVSDSAALKLGLSSDAQLFRDAADTLAQRRNTNAQAFRVYNTYVSTGVNEYLSLGFSANTALLGTLRSGSGVVRDLNILSSGIPRITVPAAHTSAVAVSGLVSISGMVNGATSTPSLAVTQVWDNAATAFNAMTVSIIPSNASASSNFIEFLSSGTSYSKLTQFGDWQAPSFTAADGNTRIGSSGIKVGVTAQYTFVHATGASSQNIAAGLTLGGSGVVRVTDGFANTGSITVRNTNSTVFSIPDGVSVDINPASGAIQTWVLGSGRTPTANNFAAGQSVTLMIDDGSGFAVNWGSMGVSWLNSTPPALPTSGYGVVELWKVGSTIYGTSVGNVV